MGATNQLLPARNPFFVKTPDDGLLPPLLLHVVSVYWQQKINIERRRFSNLICIRVVVRICFCQLCQNKIVTSESNNINDLISSMELLKEAPSNSHERLDSLTAGRQHLPAG